jgi:hypothetical protein
MLGLFSKSIIASFTLLTAFPSGYQALPMSGFESGPMGGIYCHFGRSITKARVEAKTMARGGTMNPMALLLSVAANISAGLEQSKMIIKVDYLTTH